MFQLFQIFILTIKTTAFYLVFPYFAITNYGVVSTFIVGYFLGIFVETFYTLIALFMEDERKKFWHVMLAIPTTFLFNTVFGFGATAEGTIKDVLLFGKNTRFVPATTLIEGRSERIALAYRLRRFVSLCIRSLIHGDVPLGFWWLDFREHSPYVESGYANWSSGKKSSYILK